MTTVIANDGKDVHNIYDKSNA